MSASPPPAEASASIPPTQGTKKAFDDVFGGSDSDLTDTGSEGEGDDGSAGSSGPKVAKRKAFPPRTTATPTVGVDEDEDHASPARAASPSDDEEEDEDEDGAYVPGTLTTAAKIPKFKKRRLSDGESEGAGGDGDGDEEGEGGARSKDKKKKKKKHRGERRRGGEDEGGGDEKGGEEDAGLSTLDPATQRRMELEARIDSIGRKAKPTRRPKKDDVDIVDNYHDDICERLKTRMLAAYEKDRQSAAQQLPATAKLAMLDEVMAVLRNSTLWSSIVDNQVLEAVRTWLEPLESNNALPAVGIQNAFFEVLPKMDIDITTLKESRLGPIVLFYTKTKRVTPAIHRAANALVQEWSRQVAKRPTDFRTRHVDTVDDLPGGSGGGGGGGEGGSQGQSQGSGGGSGSQNAASQQKRRRFDAAAAVRENHGRKGARMPQIRETQYTVAPEPRMVHHAEDTAQVRKIQSDNKKFNKFARQMRMNKR